MSVHIPAVLVLAVIIKLHVCAYPHSAGTCSDYKATCLCNSPQSDERQQEMEKNVTDQEQRYLKYMCKSRPRGQWSAVKVGLHVGRKHKHKPRVNPDDASTGTRKKERALVLASSRFTRGLCLWLCLRRTCKPALTVFHAICTEPVKTVFSPARLDFRGGSIGSSLRSSKDRKLTFPSRRLVTEPSSLLKSRQMPARCTSFIRTYHSGDLSCLLLHE